MPYVDETQLTEGEAALLRFSRMTGIPCSIEYPNGIEGYYLCDGLPIDPTLDFNGQLKRYAEWCENEKRIKQSIMDFFAHIMAAD